MSTLGESTLRLYTAAEAAKILHTGPWQITLACRSGKLRASKPGKCWLITEAAIHEYLADAENGPQPVERKRRKRRAA